MKKNIVLFVFIVLSVISLSAQSKKGKIEILYFKANLCACRAKACTATGNDIKIIIEECYPDKSVTYREVALADTANKKIVAKYNAQSQSLIIIKKKKKNETFLDVSNIVKEYSQKQDKKALEQDLKSKIIELEKKK